jgi:hypothetical protein
MRKALLNVLGLAAIALAVTLLVFKNSAGNASKDSGGVQRHVGTYLSAGRAHHRLG